KVGGIAGRVRQRAGLADRAQERADTLVGVTQLEDLLDHGAVLELELLDAPRAGLVVGTLLVVDAQPVLGIRRRGADHAPVGAREGDGAAAAGQAHPVDYLGDCPDLGVVVLMARHEQHLVLVADLDGQRDGHVREDDGVFQGDEQEVAQRYILQSVYQVSKLYRRLRNRRLTRPQPAPRFDGGVLSALVAAAALGLPSSWTAVAHGPAGGTVWSGRIPNREVAWDRRASAVYLPPGDGSDRRFPVIYLLHGLRGSPSSYYDGLHLADVGDRLISSHRTRPFIAVMPVGGRVVDPD